MSSPSSDNDKQTKQNRRSSITDFFTRPSYPGPITSAVAEANQRRRMSVSGTSASPSSGGFLSSFAARRGSVSSVSSAGSSTAAVDEEEGGSPSKNMGNHFARRMSFGAKAMMDVKTGRPMMSGVGKEYKPPTAAPGTAHNPSMQNKETEASLPKPIDSMPKTSVFPTKANPPDELQERMLKGHFFMD